jgi:3-methyladenine DNA glycosylase/8-oxoguanine DNA glycosylase
VLQCRGAAVRSVRHSPVDERVEKLEKAVESLADMPRQVTDLQVRAGSLELQIVQLRRALHEDVIERIARLGDARS